MNPNYKEIIVIATIDGQQKQIVLNKENALTDIYQIMIDKEYQGQVLRNTNGWGVFPHNKSWLKKENCDAILQAVLNAENPNS